ncbi:MAG: alginate export family protein [Pseudomonadota bacterium]
MLTRLQFLLLCTAMCLGAAWASPAEAKKKKGPPQAHAIFDAQKRKRTRHQISAYFSVGGYAQLSYLGERDRRRDDRVRDSSDTFEVLIGFVGKLRLRHNVLLFVHAEASLEDRRTDLTRGRLMDPHVKEALLAVTFGPNAALSFGRLRLSDAHRWVADASVDGVHWGRRWNGRVLEFAAVQGTRNVDGRYLLVHYGVADRRTKWGVFGLAEREGAADRLHLAGYYARTVSARFAYQANIGAVFGGAANGKRAGLGFDIRAIRKLPGDRLKPQITLGFAFGSAGFQQSGLHTNKTYDGGNFQFHRYGYVYQPELTNLAVLSASVGVRPSRKFSADLIVSAYAQPSRSTTGPSARINGATTGTSRFLGHEIALVGGWRPAKRTKVEFGVGRFKPGPAYVDQSAATRAFARISVQF